MCSKISVDIMNKLDIYVSVYTFYTLNCKKNLGAGEEEVKKSYVQMQNSEQLRVIGNKSRFKL
ncbi:hypothetical protein GCM10007968_21150 [Sporolactobacillus putidus]|uniref:Uncharacterized protein n=1 Tax=Sporolactobacillus putidus TaxID=492735 RepID=A0A917S5E1_9BACL|nr:hypothetical protein GCM10007968_21150 [Sporolactobacillus putidus]